MRHIGHDEAHRAATLPLERLDAEITTLAADLWAATCRWLLMVAELDRREGWASRGAKSCADWLSWKCGVEPGTAREQVRVTRALSELPAVREAFARGELSFSKVRALTRVATVESEGELVDLARHSTAAQLERIVRTYRRVTDDEAAERHTRRYLHLEWDDDGSLAIRGRLSPEDGALVAAALDAARADGHRDDVSTETSDGGRWSNADALVTMAEATLATGPTPAPGGERTQVVVHVDATTLAGDVSAETSRVPDGTDAVRCELEDGPALAPETARRLACDASIVDGHHVRHWSRGGETRLGNLVLLCRFHHRLVHEGGFRLVLHAGRRVEVHRRDGDAVAETCSGVARSDVVEDNRRRAIAPDPRTCGARSENESFDLGLTMDALIGLLGPGA